MENELTGKEAEEYITRLSKQHDEERAFYALERLWRDCPVIPLPADVTDGRGPVGD